MDIEIIQKVALWVEQRFGQLDEVSREEILEEAERADPADLPPLARNALQSLPEGRYDPPTLVSKVGALLGNGQAGRVAVVTTSTGFEGPGPER